MLEINKFDKYSILKLKSKNKDPAPENNVIKIDVIKIISKLFDFVTIPFVAISLIVKKIAAMIGKINKKLKFIFWGLITKSTPINPIITAVHLLIPTFSFKKINAKIVTKNGLVINELHPYEYELTDYDDPYPLDLSELSGFDTSSIEVNAKNICLQKIADSYEKILSKEWEWFTF